MSIIAFDGRTKDILSDAHPELRSLDAKGLKREENRRRTSTNKAGCQWGGSTSALLGISVSANVRHCGGKVFIGTRQEAVRSTRDSAALTQGRHGLTGNQSAAFGHHLNSAAIGGRHSPDPCAPIIPGNCAIDAKYSRSYTTMKRTVQAKALTASLVAPRPKPLRNESRL